MLATYGIEIDDAGRPVLTPSQIAARRRQKAERLELRTEASRALRWYWLISAGSLVTTVGWGAFLSHESDPFNRVESPWWVYVAVAVVCITVIFGAVRGLHVMMERVALAGGPQDPKERHGGWVLVAVAVLCVAAAWADQVDRLADEPAVAVATHVRCEEEIALEDCRAYWEYDGRSQAPAAGHLHQLVDRVLASVRELGCHGQHAGRGVRSWAT